MEHEFKLAGPYAVLIGSISEVAMATRIMGKVTREFF